MKKITSVVVLALSLLSFKAICQSKSEQDIKISIDLNTIKEDRVTVVVTPPKFTTNEVTYNFPKIIPGTYSEDDYGKMIVNLKAFDKNGKEIDVAKNPIKSHCPSSYSTRNDYHRALCSQNLELWLH